MSRTLDLIRLDYETHEPRSRIERSKPMKYMLMMSGTKANFDWFVKWSKQDLQAHIAFMHAFNKELKDAGALVAAEGLAFPDQAKIVRARSDGTPITDGVFPESKE